MKGTVWLIEWRYKNSAKAWELDSATSPFSSPFTARKLTAELNGQSINVEYQSVPYIRKESR